MTLREQIEAASAKATQGVWIVVGRIGLTIRTSAGDWIGKANWRNGVENAALIVTLVNAYRAGNLLVIEDEQDAVRRMAGAARYWTTDETDTRGLFLVHGPGYRKSFAEAEIAYRHVKEMNATAALAALKGESA